MIAAVGLSYVATGHLPVNYQPMPLAIIVGLVAITFTGLADDVWGWDPRLKVAGQLVAAAALAIEEVGVKVAAGVVLPIAKAISPTISAQDLVFIIPIGDTGISFDLVYWLGTGIIAVFVLGGCNAANLIDGLDGLLSGVTAIAAAGLLAIALVMALVYAPDGSSPEQTTLAGARIILCLAVLGAVLGFLPYNFNPASIFLGDCGSLLLGYCSVVVILMLGDEGQTHLVVAGLIVFSIPIIDTILAIVRRKLRGVSVSEADDEHLHHKLKRRLGTVPRAVLALYALGLALATTGAGLAILVMVTEWRARVIYAFFLALYVMIGVLAVWLGRQSRRGSNPKAPPAT